MFLITVPQPQTPQKSVSDGATTQLGSSGLARVLADYTPLVAATE